MNWYACKGIVNIGNSCYLNSSIQLFMSMKKLLISIIKHKNTDNNNININICFKKLIIEYFSKKNNNHLNISYIKKYVLSDYLKKSSRQEDADECLNDIINKCIDVFGVKSLLNLEINQINSTNKKIETTNEISLYLDIPEIKNISITKCLTNYTKYYDEDKTRRFFIKNIGDYLLITLKRFKRKGHIIVKNNTPVFPNFVFSIDGKHCHLTSVIIHKGHTIDNGHYVSMVKKNNEWFLFDDTKVTKINKNVENILSQGYIWLYTVSK